MQWHTHVHNTTLAIQAFLNSSKMSISDAADGADDESKRSEDRGQFAYGAYYLQQEALVREKCTVSVECLTLW